MAGLDGAITLSVPALIGVASGLVIVVVAVLVTVRGVRAARRRRSDLRSERGYEVGIATVRGPRRGRSNVSDTATPDFTTAPETTRWPVRPELDLASGDESEVLPTPRGEASPIARRLLGARDRSVGLDAARGVFLLALLVPAFLPSSATLVLGGVSAAEWCSRSGLAGLLLVSAAVSVSALRRGEGDAAELSRRRLRRLARSALLLPLAAGLIAFDAPGGAVVLLVAVLAPLTILLAPLRPRVLVPLGLLALIMAPVASAAGAFLLSWPGTSIPAAQTVVAVAEWYADQGASLGTAVVAILVGAFLGSATAGRFLGRALVALSGGILAAGGLGALLLHPGLDALPAWAIDVLVAPDRASVAVLMASVGLAIGVISVLLLIEDPLRAALLVLSAPGSMTLTAAVVTAAITTAGVPAMAGPMLPAVWMPFVAVLVLVAGGSVLWRLALGDGPLERVMEAILRRTAPEAVPTVAARDTGEETRALAPQEGRTVRTATLSEIGQSEAPMTAPATAPTLPEPATLPAARVADPPPVSHWTPGQALGRLPY
ncbi:hypothetical protein ACFJGV_03995 [Cnuibacter sp. UC19_7]|uniref:hypothetical protein n=1 Tax=Cnuibacter sp. UC19_7 TaxID=3350166 RepID=UPI00366BCA7E